MDPFGVLISSLVYSSLCISNRVVDLSTLYQSDLPPPSARSEPPRPTFISLPLAVPVASERVGSECPICLDVYVEDDMVITLICNHTYHPTCIERWKTVATHRVCPLCRTPMG